MTTTNTRISTSHEQDPRWTAVEEYTLSHVHPPSRPNHPALTHALEYSLAEGLPDISAGPPLGKFLALQCRIGRVKHALEVGTLGGYTSIWIASENPDIKVTTLEINERHAEVARKNVEKAGLTDRVNVIVGPALQSLAKLQVDIASGQQPRLGFAFIDADKPNNWAYFDYAVKLSVPGACIVVDNVVRQGGIITEEGKRDVRMQGARKVIEEAGKDERVEATCLQLVSDKNYDGILMAVVK